MLRRSLLRAGPALLLGASPNSAEPIDPPALPGSGMANFTQSDTGKVYLSWIDPLPDNRHALRVSRWRRDHWSAPETVAEGAHWFVNWADFPALSSLPDGQMLAHWLARPATGGKWGYGIHIAHRNRSGEWKPTAAFNAENMEDYAGFLSFAGANAVFLAPPDQPAGHQKTLRFARFDARGQVIDEAVLDTDVCSCCQTAIAMTPHGLLAAYRDHRPGEIRDISFVRQQKGVWTAPQTLHADGWKINGCPTEGPTIAVAGNSVALAWLTRAGGVAKLQCAFSLDGGATFSRVIRVDDGNPLGRPCLLRIPTGFALAWIERDGNQATLSLRVLHRDGKAASSLVVASVAPARGTGLPRLALASSHLFLAWRDERVRVARVPLSALPSQ
ncbi:MAG: hypothetical protein OHK0021_09650 [Bryobacter sp.]